MGHAEESMDDLYDKVREDVVLRKKWAEQCGIGFDLPSQLYRMYQKQGQNRKPQKPCKLLKL
jgi:hypothetical protein